MNADEVGGGGKGLKGLKSKKETIKRSKERAARHRIVWLTNMTDKQNGLKLRNSI